MTVFHAVGTDQIVVGYGDRLAEGAPIPADGTLEQVLGWCALYFARFGVAVLRKNTAVLVSDPMGTCPLFYGVEAERLAIASQGRYASATGDCPNLVDFGDLRPVPVSGRTIFENVSVVPPATMRILKWDGRRWAHHGDQSCAPLLMAPLTGLDERVAAHDLLQALSRAVKQAVQGYSRVRIGLSGGVDSTSVACLAHAEGVDVTAYTVGTRYGDEYDAAATTAEELGIQHTRLSMSAEQLGEIIPRLIAGYETWDPLTIEIATGAAFLYEQTRDPDSLFLTGYGSDLLFAGTLDTSIGADAIEQIVRAQILHTARTNEMHPAFAAACGATVRYPFWNGEVVRVAMEISAHLKLAGGVEKWILRSALAPVLPEAVTWRKKLGIHEGSGINRLLADALGASGRSDQAAALREIAADVFSMAPPSFERDMTPAEVVGLS